MQKLLAALASQSISPEAFTPSVQPHHHQHLLAPSPYDPSQPTIGPGTGLDKHPNDTTPTHLPPTTYDYTPANVPSPFNFSLLGGPSDADQIVPFEQHDEKLQKSYRTATEIHDDVDELQNNIQSLIQSLGIDPGTLDVVLPPSDGVVDTAGGGIVGSSAGGLVGAGASAVDMYPIGNNTDFDFDSFLMDMPRTTEDDGDLERLAERLESSSVIGKSAEISRIGNPSSEHLHAFLDNVASQDEDGDAGRTGSVGMGMMPTHGGTQAQFQELHASQILNMPASSGGGGHPTTPAATTTGARGRKRKSDVIVDVGDTYPLQEQTTTTPNASSILGNRSKRKR
jgi:heat shock transcription factor